MHVILETPYAFAPIQVAMLARQNGRYARPVVGAIVDLRVEDLMPPHISSLIHIIARLPDVAEVNQVNKYLVASMAQVERVDVSFEEVQTYLQQGYVMLPSDQQSAFWAYTKAPWWEYAVVLDDHDGFIKAPKRPRANEPHAEMIDERLDEFTENRGKLRVLSPTTLEEWQKQKVSEPYQDRLSRI